MTRHLIIPDTQVKPGDTLEHLEWAGHYAVNQKPDVIIHVGDHFDMPSLSVYDKGKKRSEGARYENDIAAGIAGMEAFLTPIWEEQARLRRNKEKIWKPRLVFTLGNHEERILRAVEDDAKWEGKVGLSDLRLEEMGWEVYPFLEPVCIDGVMYAHYFTSGVMGRPVSSARALLTKKMQSCVQGHIQDRDIAFSRRADGTQMTGLFVGIFYQHNEDYLTPQTNNSWRGVWVLNECRNGGFDELPVSINYLREKYGAKNAA